MLQSLQSLDTVGGAKQLQIYNNNNNSNNNKNN